MRSGLAKQCAAGLVALMFGTLVIVAAFEGVVRFLFLPRAGKRVSDRPVHYYLPERSQSLRDSFYEPAKPPNTFRIGVIGDSFAFGFNNHFDDAFPKRMERILNLNENQPRVEVINFGTPGLSTQREIGWVDTALEKYSADVIILQITLNDPELVPYHDSRHSLSAGLSGGLLTGGILDYWKGLAFVLTRLENTSSQRDYVAYFHELFRNPASRKSFEDSLSAVAERCNTKNARLLAVVFPLFAMPLDERYPFVDIHEDIGSLLDSRNILRLDLLDRFRGMSNDRLQAIPGADPHPSELAHRIAAEAIISKLASEKLIPEAAVPKLQQSRRDAHRFLPQGRP